MPTATLVNPFLHPDIVIHLEEGQRLDPDVVTVARSHEVRGGAGLYTAAAMRWCGWDVVPADSIGSDFFGELTMRQLVELGCRHDHIKRYDGDHMFVTSIADRDSLGGTMVSSCPPAWQQPAVVMESAIRGLPGADACYIWSWFWSYANPHVASMDIEAVLAHCRGRADLLAVDPNWKPSGPPPEAEVAGLRAAARDVDVLKLNVRDAATLVGPATPPDALRRLLDLGPRVVLLTMGADGCLLGEADTARRWKFAAPPLGRRDTTGAGDVLGGVFVARFVDSGCASTAASEAMAVAALAVSGRPWSAVHSGEVTPLVRTITEGRQEI